MKKVYNIPQLQIVHIAASDIIATSGPSLGVGFSDPTESALSRRGCDWDDDDWD